MNHPADHYAYALKKGASPADIHDFVVSALKRLDIPVLRSNVGGHKIVAYGSPGSRRSPQLSMSGVPVQIVVLTPLFKSDLPQDINMFPTKHVAEYVHRLAATYRVTYERSRLEDWAEAVTRASGDNVQTDHTSGLLIRLKQRKIFDARQFTKLLINHRKESANV